MSMVIDGSNGLTYPNSATNGGYINGGNAVTSTSGTAITFTGIPSWVKRVTVMLNASSLSGTSDFMIQVGSGSITSSGYIGGASRGTTAVTNSNGFKIISNNGATQTYSGIAFLTTLGGNIWTQSGNFTSNGADACTVSGGVVSLSGTLDRVVIASTNGTDTFDAGSINILYE